MVFTTVMAFVGGLIYFLLRMNLSISGANTIRLRTENSRYEEGIASGAISPGMNVVLQTAAEAQGRQTYAAGATLTGGTAATSAFSPVAVAIEDGLVGKTVNDAYANGDTFRFHIPRRGDVLQVLVASGLTVTKGQGVYALASGKWSNATATNPVAEALEASGGALAADTLMRVRFY